jgi:hypothetical protein
MFCTGQDRKTDPVDAHSVAVVDLRTPGLQQVVVDDTTVALRLLVDRRDQLGHARTEPGPVRSASGSPPCSDKGATRTEIGSQRRRHGRTMCGCE